MVIQILSIFLSPKL